MRKVLVACAGIAALAFSTGASASGWTTTVPFTNQVASTPVAGGGYTSEGGAPSPGGCGPTMLNSNRSESWIAVKPGTEDLVGTSKFFVDKWSTYYNFHLGSYTIPNGVVASNNQVQGYECTTVGTQDMPPSWTNNTDPNADFDTQGRVYQTTLPFNAYWTNLHPNAAVMLSYSDDLGKTWVKGNGGRPLEQSPNASSVQFGHVEDKQWVAVDHFGVSKFKDRVYAMWAIFNGSAIKVAYAWSKDRGQTFSKVQTLSPPSEVGPAVTYVIPSVGADGTVYVAVTSFPPNGAATHIYVTSSKDGGVTWAPFSDASGVVGINDVKLPNTRFRDGIVDSFAASPTYPGHLYMTWEEWDGAQFDVYFAHSENGGLSWSDRDLVNDNADRAANDQFQPQVAAGPGGAVAVAFYDRRQACPSDKSVAPADRGLANLCIDTTLQAYRDSGSGPVPVLGNARFSTFTWDPEQPLQTVDGLRQDACASHNVPCRTTFIGDYFGLAVSGSAIYGLFVSTHYASKVKADGGGSVYYQQQVLATAPRSGFGAGY